MTRIALVTGAGSGIGRAVSEGLAAAGFTGGRAGRRRPPRAGAAAAIAAAGGRALAVLADVTDEAATRALFGRVAAEYGRLDLLFNNAGIAARPVPLEELALAEWRAVIDTNLTGAFLCTQEALRLMKRQAPRGGRIINNGSISAHVPRPLSAPYTASKHALLGLTKSTALDGRAFDIACGQIDIGNAATAIAGPIMQGALQANGTRLAEPTIDPRHVADAVRYMAGLPLSANVLNLTVMASGMPFVGRG